VHDPAHNLLFSASDDSTIKIWQHASFAYALCLIALRNKVPLDTLQNTNAFAQLSNKEKEDIQKRIEQLNL